MKSPKPHSEPPEARDILAGRNVVVCVTGGIAAYKAVYLTRLLVKAGARVRVVMTAASQHFVGPLTFETLSGNPVVTSSFDRVFQMGAVEHVDLAAWADAVVVAPATYNCLGKLHAGIADDAVTTYLSAVVSPVVIAPAMNEHMWRNPINQRNVAELRRLGYHCVDPERGGLACSWEGEGRMAEPERILETLRGVLAGAKATVHGAGSAAAARPPAASNRALQGMTLLVTAAGTWEAIDPVRFLGNRSSGRMGYALAEAARRRGARVLLVSGPSALEVPAGLEATRRVETAEEMLRACRDWLPQSDVLLMTAAVADYRPRRASSEKIKRSGDALQLDLEPTPDVIAALRPDKGARLFVGFALETGQDLGTAAQEKLHAKGLDLVVANRVGPDTGPEHRTNQVSIWNREGLVQSTPVLPKRDIAEIILDVVEAELAQRRTTTKT